MRGANTRISTRLGAIFSSPGPSPPASAAYCLCSLGRRAGPSRGQRNTRIDGSVIAGAANGPSGNNGHGDKNLPYFGRNRHTHALSPYHWSTLLVWLGGWPLPFENSVISRLSRSRSSSLRTATSLLLPKWCPSIRGKRDDFHAYWPALCVW